jgi:hypothetical protein
MARVQLGMAVVENVLVQQNVQPAMESRIQPISALVTIRSSVAHTAHAK